MAWSGRAAVASVRELLSGITGSIFDYMMMRHLDGAWELDEELTSRLGLDYEALVLKLKLGGSYDTFKLVEAADGVSLVPCTAMAEDSLVRYLIQHRALVTELVNELDEVSGFA